ncbi:MAG: PEP-CTERM sorting domain-containing protein [Acidobacteriota bacterium]
MSTSIVRTAQFGLALLVSHSAFADWVTIPAVVDGKTSTYSFSFDVPLLPASHFVRADGTKVNVFDLHKDDGSYWDESFYKEFATELAPDGSSSLIYRYGYDLPCHGGCINSRSTRFEFTSPTNALYSDSIDSSVFSKYESGTGTDEIRDASFVTGEGRWETHTYVFPKPNPSPVPEPNTFAALMAGLAGVLAMRRLQRPTRQEA